MKLFMFVSNGYKKDEATWLCGGCDVVKAPKEGSVKLFGSDYSGLTQPNSLQTCSSALPSDPKGLSALKSEKKCRKMLCDQSSGEANHSISKATKCIVISFKKCCGVRQCCLHR